MKSISAAVVQAFWPVLLFAFSAFAAKAPSPEAVQRGRALFQPACGFCHGEDATGSRGPDLIRSPLVGHDESGETIAPVIRSGRPDKGMPAFSYTDAQISDIAAFLQAQVLAALRSNHVPGDYPAEKLLTGNAAAGKAYFVGAGGCSGCHSTAGDLAGIANKYSPIDLQSRFLYPRGARSTVTVTLPDGKQISGRLLLEDEFTIALRDSSGWYHSFATGAVKYTVRDPLKAHRDLLYKYTDADIHNLFAYLESLK